MSDQALVDIETSEQELVPQPKFIHLRLHSDYSMCDGLNKVKPIIAKAADLGMPALALTDQTNLCGLVKYYHAAHGAGNVSPMTGVLTKSVSKTLSTESKFIIPSTPNL